MLRDGVISDVIYFYDLTDERKEEARLAAARYGFTPHFSDGYDDFGDVCREDTLIVPMMTDEHPDHKRLNYVGREMARRHNCNILFYSVDMNVSQLRSTLPPSLRAEKKAALAELYPSQSVLLANEKYHLFECIVKNEIVESVASTLGDKWIKISGWDLPPTSELNAALEKIDTIDAAIFELWSSSFKELVFFDGQRGYTYGG